MKQIDPHTLYTGPELRRILRGSVKLEKLRPFGLASPGNGYWGQNVIDSLNRYLDNGNHKRTGRVKKEVHLESKTELPIFDKRKVKVSNQKVHPAPGKSHPLESEWERFKRIISEDSV